MLMCYFLPQQNPAVRLQMVHPTYGSQLPNGGRVRGGSQHPTGAGRGAGCHEDQDIPDQERYSEREGETSWEGARLGPAAGAAAALTPGYLVSDPLLALATCWDPCEPAFRLGAIQCVEWGRCPAAPMEKRSQEGESAPVGVLDWPRQALGCFWRDYKT